MDKMVIPNRVRVVAVMSALALAGGLLTLVLLAKHTQAQPPTDKGNGAVVENFPFHATTDTSLPDSGCVNGEGIDITGTLHTVTHFVPVQDGYHVNSTFSLVNARGVGFVPGTLEPTGNEYVISSRTQSVENFLPTGDTVGGNVIIETDIGKGSSPDRVYFATAHYVLTEDGVVKAEVVRFFLQCPGSETVPPTASASAVATTP
jgi:hypothetical protein